MPPLGGLEQAGFVAHRAREGAFAVTEHLRLEQVSGIAAQLMATNGRLDRREFWWMKWAISSFPLPLSPVMNTDASVGATLRASSIDVAEHRRRPRAA